MQHFLAVVSALIMLNSTVFVTPADKSQVAPFGNMDSYFSAGVI